MTGFIKKAMLGIATMMAAFTMASPEAKAYADDYCREYTRTVYIGGRAEEAYGRACLQPNGDWMIVDENLGSDVPVGARDVDYVIQDRTRVVIPDRTVYYSQPRINVYRTVPRSNFIFYSNSNRYVKHYNNRPPQRWNNNGHYGRDNDDNNGHHGRGGRDRDHDRGRGRD